MAKSFVGKLSEKKTEIDGVQKTVFYISGNGTSKILRRPFHHGGSGDNFLRDDASLHDLVGKNVQITDYGKTASYYIVRGYTTIKEYGGGYGSGKNDSRNTCSSTTSTSDTSRLAIVFDKVKKEKKEKEKTQLLTFRAKNNMSIDTSDINNVSTTSFVNALLDNDDNDDDCRIDDDDENWDDDEGYDDDNEDFDDED